jgi:hypothetical protein
MTKETQSTESAQFNRVDKIEINVGSLNLWLVLGVMVLVIYLLGKVNSLERKLGSIPVQQK